MCQGKMNIRSFDVRIYLQEHQFYIKIFTICRHLIAIHRHLITACLFNEKETMKRLYLQKIIKL